jgi:hypothetical protein
MREGLVRGPGENKANPGASLSPPWRQGAGRHSNREHIHGARFPPWDVWIPACAGMTESCRAGPSLQERRAKQSQFPLRRIGANTLSGKELRAEDLHREPAKTKPISLVGGGGGAYLKGRRDRSAA